MTLLLAAATLLAGSQKWTTPTEIAVSHFAVADFNADKRPDLVVVGENKGLVVMLNTGGGQFTTAARVPEAGNASEVVAADLNGDGHLDVATAAHDTFLVMIFVGDGKGGLRKLSTVRAKPTGKPHVHGLLVNGKDLLFVSSEEGQAVPLLNDGKGNFTPGPILKTPAPWNPAMGDVNHDGQPDFIAGTFGGKQVHVWLGQGRDSFKAAPGSPHTVFPRVFTTKLADLNGDGHLDIYACHDDYGRLTVLFGDGKGGFTQMPGSPIDVGKEAYGVQALGRDLATVTNKGEVFLYRQTKPGVYASSPEVLDTGAGGYRMLAADFDGDGATLELAIADPERKVIRFYRHVPRN